MHIFNTFLSFFKESFGNVSQIASLVISFLQNFSEGFVADFSHGQRIQNRRIANPKPQCSQWNINNVFDTCWIKLFKESRECRDFLFYGSFTAEPSDFAQF